MTISKTSYAHIVVLITALLMIEAPLAATLNLSNVPLSSSTSVNPNVFFELDDSGSMDWEIMTQKYWTWRAYNPDETLIGNSGTSSSDAGTENQDGLWDSYTQTASGGWGGGGSSSYSYASSTFRYIFNNSDNLYTDDCGGALSPCGAFTTAANYPYKLDWRVLSAAFNTVYYDPSKSYFPWSGQCLTAGTACANASFTAARSNPREGQSGYSVTRNLTGIVYEVWVDDKGYSGSRPRRGSNRNVTSTPNGIVDLWDKHITYTVNATSVTYTTTTYTPTNSSIGASTTTVTTISGTQTDPYGRTVAQIQQNVANWYQYHRKRSLTAKAAIASVISENENFRYGLSVINNSGTLFREVPASSVSDYTSHNTALLNALFNYVWPASGTPLRVGLRNVGEYYDGNLSGKTDPIISPCQKCFTILITDGYWNETFSAINDADGDGIQRTLADVARYYYTKDLSSLANNVQGDAFDPVTHQHMVTYTVAFGLKGDLVDTDGDGWPNPVLTESSNWGNPTTCSDCAEKIDDMWHAAYNSRGTYISAGSSTALAASLRSAFEDINNRVASVAAVALNSGSLNALNKLYQVKFNAGQWEGYLEASNVTAGTGAVGAVAWEAGSLLPAPSSRAIITRNGSAGVPFEWASLSASQQLALNTSITGAVDTLGSDRLDYLRGNESQEMSNGGTFRDRTNTKLGDIVNSAPQYSGAEHLGYTDTLEAALYSTYVKNTKATRTPVIFAGANDGMLHAFHATTGVELLAYVPTKVYSNLSKLTAPTYSHRYFVDGTPTVGDAYYGGAWHTVLAGGLGGGGQGIFALDVTNPANFSQANASTLVMWEFTDANDVDLGYTFSRPNIAKMANGTWAAIFGNGYNNTESDGNVSTTGAAVLYIVNVQTGALIKKITTGAGMSQDPKATSRANGLATVTPVDVNQDGITDYIYGGDLFGNLWKFDVTSTSTSSWGSAFTSGGNPAPLFKACGGATCSGANAQSITTRATVTFGPNRIGYMVLFGTGKYLESTDIGDLSTQTFYGIWDKNDGTTVSGRGSLLQQTVLFEGSYALQDGSSISMPLRVTSNNSYTGSPPTSQRGWYLDLLPPSPAAGQGERFVYQPSLRNGKVIFTTIIPNSNSCSGGGDSWLVSLDALSGARVSGGTFDLNNDGQTNSSEYVQVTIGGAAQWVAVSQVKYGLLTNAAIACNGARCKGFISGGEEGEGDTLVEMGMDIGASNTGRESWRQIK